MKIIALSREKRKQMGSRHFDFFPFEKIHSCDTDGYNCIMEKGACVQTKKIIMPLSLIVKSRGDSPRIELANDQYFFIQISFPTISPVIKLINVNGTSATIDAVLDEFSIFYEEVFCLERQTLEEKKIEIQCTDCLEEDFSRLVMLEQTCLICLEEEESAVLDCGHCMCMICLQKWFSEKNACPFCRTPIKPCVCGGAREQFQLEAPPPLEFFFSQKINSTGVFRLRPFFLDEIFFSCLVYDRLSNVFHLIRAL